MSPRWPIRYKAFYDAYYQELLASSVIERWQKIDLIINLLVAVTASGSALTGLALWNTSWGKPLWASVAAIASLGAIFHTTAGVSKHLEQQSKARHDFSLLRAKLQTILYRMTSDGDSAELEINFEELNSSLGELTAELQPDLASTRYLREKAQTDLKSVLERLGVPQSGTMLEEVKEDE